MQLYGFPFSANFKELWAGSKDRMLINAPANERSRHNFEMSSHDDKTKRESDSSPKRQRPLAARRVLACAVLACCVGGAAFLIWPTPEPEFNGHTYSYWLDIYCDTPAPIGESTGKTRAEAESALKAIGTNAMPILVNLLRESEISPLRLVRLRIINRFRMMTHQAPIQPSLLQWKAAEGLLLLGTKAAPAVPELASALMSRPTFPFGILRVLRNIGPSASNATPAVAAYLRNTNSTDLREGILTLSTICLDPEIAVPNLHPLLTNSYTPVREEAWNALLHCAASDREAAMRAAWDLFHDQAVVPGHSYEDGRPLTVSNLAGIIIMEMETFSFAESSTNQNPGRPHPFP